MRLLKELEAKRLYKRYTTTELEQNFITLEDFATEHENELPYELGCFIDTAQNYLALELLRRYDPSIKRIFSKKYWTQKTFITK